MVMIIIIFQVGCHGDGRWLHQRWVGYGEEDWKMPPAKKAILLVKIIPGVLAGANSTFVHLSILARDNKINREGPKHL